MNERNYIYVLLDLCASRLKYEIGVDRKLMKEAELLKCNKN